MSDFKEKFKPLYSGAQIRERCKQLAEEIENGLSEGGPLLCVCVLRGAVMFFAELTKHFKREVSFDFITLSSYENATYTGGTVKLIHDLRESAENRHVLIVEDIVDSGNTAGYLKKYFSDKKAASVRLACLLDKPLARRNDYKPDFSAFTLQSDKFVVGYGMDYRQLYRNLDGVYELVCGSDGDGGNASSDCFKDNSN